MFSTKHSKHRFFRCAAACAAALAITVGLASPGRSLHAATADAAGYDAQILSVRLASAQQGWMATRSQLLRTEDSGRHWLDITPSASLLAIEAAQFRDADEAWVILATRENRFVLAHTIDAGASWAQRALSAVEGAPLALHFVDMRNGWLMLRTPSSSNFQRGTLLRTRDGGETWQALPAPPIVDAVAFVSKQVGWLAGGPERDHLYVTYDGGMSWRSQPLPMTKDAGQRAVYQLPQFRSAREGSLAVSIGNDESTQIRIFDTEDAGLTWLPKESLPLARGNDGARVAMALVDAQTTWLAPQADRLSLRSNVVAQRERPLTNGLPQGGAIAAIEFSSVDHGWLLQRRGVCAEGKTRCRQETRLFLTDDGALNLIDITPPLGATHGDEQTDSVFISHNHKGFDQCAAGTVSQMQAWWTSTPWSDANIYIGGENSACDATNDARLTPAWIKAVLAQGWHLIPTWVGKQAPTSGCSGCSKLSTDPVTARTQGIAEANAAQAKARSIGLQTPTVIYYDMEGYSGSSAATAAFLDGWTERMHELGNTSGIYGGASNASTDWYPLANRADAVWIAAWNGQASVFGISGLADSKWDNQQRIHQYQGGHDETWNSVTFNIDSNYEDGPVAAVDCIFCDGFE